MTGSEDATARIWDLTAKNPAATSVVLRGHESTVYAVGISPDNHWLVTGSWDGTARLWDLTARTPEGGPGEVRGHEGPRNPLGNRPKNPGIVYPREHRTT